MNEKDIILVVDDAGTNLRVAKEALEPEYQVVLVNSGERALKYLSSYAADLILLDIRMPGMDGYAVLKKIRAIPGNENTPVMFLTGESDIEAEVKGLEAGAIDFIRKPFAPQTLKERIKLHLELAAYRHHLEEVIEEKTAKLIRTEDALVQSLADLVEVRDGQTGGHVRRVAKYFEILLWDLYENKTFPEIDKAYINRMRRGAVLHDIGKVGIADGALLKNSRLSDEEMEYMKLHTTIGSNALSDAIAMIGDEDTFLMDARDLAHFHHEKWNGNGYPLGLKEEEIPLGARILAVADVYDALTSRRPYKEPYSHETAYEIITEGAGSNFDARVVDSFIRVQKEFDYFRSEFIDRNS